jgi:GGDEF domain-containing protein
MGLGFHARHWAAAGMLLLAVCQGAAWGRTVLELDVARQPVPLKDWGDAWIDAGGKAPVERVAGDASIPWEPTSEHTAIYPLTSSQALWVRFTIPPAPDADRWYLEIPYPTVDRVTLYTQDSIGQWQSIAAGDHLPVADWPVPHRHPLLPLNISAEVPRTYLLRVENAHSFSAPLTFVSEGHVSRVGQLTSLILGIYFGLAGLAVALAILSALSLHDRAYAFYALSVLLMALSQAALTGIGGLHLWPYWARWNDLSPFVLPVLTVGALVWFFGEAVAMPERSRRLAQLLLAVALLSVAVALGFLFIEPSHRFKLMVPYVVGAAALCLGSVAWAATRGDRYAVWLLCGIAPVAIGAAFPTLRLMGLIPISFMTMHAMQLGIAVELPVMLLILMMRSQHRREHNRRLQDFDRIDPTTGLLNARFFEHSLVRMMARSARLKYESAVLVIDIKNVDEIRRNFGARSAEELPLRVAGRLLGAAREIDAVARLGEFRFGMLIEGPLTPEDAASEGPRIVARCLMPFKGKPLDWVSRVRVAQTIVPAQRADAAQVIGRLEALLANVSPESKRAVFTLTS